MIQVFVDTEFTQFSDPVLISIGAVVDGERHFYGIATDFPLQACSRFVREHVLAFLHVRPAQVEGSNDLVARQFVDWLLAIREPDALVEIVSDDECDLELVRRLVARSRSAVVADLVRYRLWQDQGTRERYEAHFASVPGQFRHNALDDACALRLSMP